MIPFVNEMSFSYKFKNSTIYIQLSFEEKVKDVDVDIHPAIKIKCMTAIPKVSKEQ